MNPSLLRLLRELAISDEGAVRRVMSGQPIDPALLDDRTSSMVKLAALTTLDADHPSYQSALAACLAAGVEDEEIAEIVQSVAVDT